MVPRSRAQRTIFARCSGGSTCPVGLAGEFTQASRTGCGPIASVLLVARDVAPARRAPASYVG